MHRIAILLAVLTASVSGCATTFRFDPFAAGEARLTSDARLYGDAYRLAVMDYEAEPTLGFDTHLERALGDIGMTIRGFRAYESHHADFATALDATYGQRISAAAASEPFVANVDIASSPRPYVVVETRPAVALAVP